MLNNNHAWHIRPASEILNDHLACWNSGELPVSRKTRNKKLLHANKYYERENKVFGAAELGSFSVVI